MRFRNAVLVLTLLSTLAVAAPASAMTAEIWFPVQKVKGVVHHSNYGDPRSGGRTHDGNDIMAPQMTEVYSTVSGFIRRAYGGDSRECLDGGRCTSYGFLVYGDDGNSYFYLHLNDDTPGRPNGCDHTGGAENAFSPRLTKILRERGTLEPLPRPWNTGDVVRVEQGELLGYVGSSGNAGCRVDHLHFEMWAGHQFLGADDDRKPDPYRYLRAALDAGRFWGASGATNLSAPKEPAPIARDRVAGANRVQTSVELSKRAFASAQSVVIAPAMHYPEALVAAPLAATLDAPVLLTWSDQVSGRDLLDDAVANEIRRLGASYVVIVGGTGRLGPELESQLQAKVGLAPTQIRRISGSDRYDLSRKVAEQVLTYHGLGTTMEPLAFTRSGAAGSVSPILALGEHEVASRGWPDALAASVVAARQEVPILLTRPNELPAATRALLQRSGIGEVRIVGGSAAVSDTVESAVRGLGLSTRRLAGADRFHTSIVLASEATNAGASNAEVFVATGSDFPDALASGQALATLGKVLILVPDDPGASSIVSNWLRTHAEAGAIKKITAIGGTAVVSEDALREVAVFANWPV